MLSSLVLAAAITIPPYPDATAFCSQHVIGAPNRGLLGSSINWTAYHSADAPETVVAWYQRQFAAGLHTREGKADVWRIPADQPEAVLSVTAVADAPSPIAACKERPPATARTVILMSTMTRHADAPPAAGVEVVREPRQLTGDGAPDLH
jgi:hypothetical protein